MGKYLYVYKGGTVADTDEAREASMAAWARGSPRSATLRRRRQPDRLVDRGRCERRGRDGSGVSGYSLVQAGSLDEAAAKAKGCPVLAGGGAVEVYETFDVM